MRQSCKKDSSETVHKQITVSKSQSHLAKDFQCAINQIHSMELDWFLWPGDNQNHELLQFQWKIKPICIVRSDSDGWYAVGDISGVVAEEIWPEHWSNEANNVKGDHHYVRSWLEQRFKLHKKYFAEWLNLTFSVLYRLSAKKMTLAGSSQNMTPLLTSATILNTLIKVANSTMDH